MKLNPVPQPIAHAGLRALKTVCLTSSKESLSELQAQFISGVQNHILKTNFSLDSIIPISPEELASCVTETEFQERILRACILAACIDGSVDGAEMSQIEKFAKSLKVDTSPVKTAWNLAKEHLLLARIDIVRKSLPRSKIKQTLHQEGLLATIKQFFPLIGIEIPDVTLRYKKLLDYPDGTLGKEFTHYLGRNGFPFPGEKGAGPEIIVLHDCLHILGDYGTSAPEEIEVASFQAGCHTGDPIYGLLFGLAQYHLDIQVAPVAPSQKLQANPEQIIAAFARGCQVNRDMWTEFNPWDHFGKQIESLRQELGITPKT
jgi:hypothetical protein